MTKKFKKCRRKKSDKKSNYYVSKEEKYLAKYVGKGKKIARPENTPKYPGVCIREGDIKYLDSWKRNYTRDDLIFVTYGKHYKAVWFEEGKPDKQSGFGHMKFKTEDEKTSHVDDLNAVFHVDEKHIPLFLKRVIKKGKATRIKKRYRPDGVHLKGYDVTYQYKNKRVILGIGTNGYISNAFPKTNKKMKRRKRND